MVSPTGAADGHAAVGLADFTAEFDVELSFKEGDALTVLEVQAPEGWLMARDAAGKEGLVPESYLGQADDKEVHQDQGQGEEGLLLVLYLNVMFLS